ncbi:MAG: PA14 domain-containing protein, partial [Bacteroidales bacterium]
FNRMRPFANGKTPEITLDMAPSDDYFGLVFTAYIMIPEDEVYSFYTVSDDGSSVYIDDKLVTLNDGQHGVREELGQVGLKKGLHKIEVRYFDNWYDEFLEVYVSSPKLKKQKIENLVLK